ncbi:MAG TPA: HEPN domain-containing protein [Candidatus Omnitrophota bacterium]|nr:HEPN domain-containing protein [Candidatus Omnitrophota bacterium]
MSPYEDQLIIHRREKASNMLEDARLLFERKRYFSCVNRIYYACFYEITALMIKDDFKSSKHTGVKSFFMQQYVKTGKVAGEWGSFYAEIFKYRHDSDYKDFVQFDDQSVMEWLDKAQEFIQTLEKFFG